MKIFGWKGSWGEGGPTSFGGGGNGRCSYLFCCLLLPSFSKLSLLFLTFWIQTIINLAEGQFFLFFIFWAWHFLGSRRKFSFFVCLFIRSSTNKKSDLFYSSNPWRKQKEEREGFTNFWLSLAFPLDVSESFFACKNEALWYCNFLDFFLFYVLSSCNLVWKMFFFSVEWSSSVVSFWAWILDGCWSQFQSKSFLGFFFIY